MRLPSVLLAYALARCLLGSAVMAEAGVKPTALVGAHDMREAAMTHDATRAIQR